MNILNIFRRDDSIERERDAIKSELAETVKERNSLDARFKTAIKDLAESSTTIATLRHKALLDRETIQTQARHIGELRIEIAALKTDAEKLRNKRANDAALKREKRAAAKAQPIAA